MGFSEREKLRNADLPEFLHEVTDAICDKLQEVMDERDAAISERDELKEQVASLEDEINELKADLRAAEKE